MAAPIVPLAKPVSEIPVGSLSALRRAAADCRRCPLWRPATQTVFGTGRARARVMLVGEQPGDREDLAGVPFVGPAGELLDAALAAAGLDRDALWLTNTVKHFKFERSGKVRLHKRANAGEQAACRPWLAAELLRVKPELVVALGAMAAQTLLGAAFRISRERGTWRALPAGTAALATWHPAAVLRARPEDRARLRAEFFADVAAVAARLD